MKKRIIPIVIVLFAASLQAASGDLDTDFSSDGKVRTSIGTFDTARDIAVQPDGRLVVVGQSDGNVAVARYAVTGALDTSFSGDGMVTTDIGGNDDHATSVVLQPDGRIVVAGGFGASIDHDFLVLRYNSNGTLDTTFGEGGIAAINFGEAAQDVALDGAGRIVVVGSEAGDVALARLTANGDLDTTFSGDGLLTGDFGTPGDRANAVAIQTNGFVVIAGATFTGGNPFDDDVGDFLVVRLDPESGLFDGGFGAGSDNGAPTTTLGGNGFDVASDIVIQPDGKIVVVGESLTTTGSSQIPGTTNRHMAAVRYNTNGHLDTTFAGDGIGVYNFGTISSASAVALLPDDGFVLVGFADAGFRANFAVARLRADGFPDTSFSGDGILTTDLNGADDFANGVAVQPLDGRIVVTGLVRNRNASNTVTGADFGLVRYHMFTCQGANVTRVGTRGADTLLGRAIPSRGGTFALVDVINGLAGNDFIDGGGNDDILCGGSGSDTLIGGAGDDILAAGSGADSLNGSSGSDSCFGVFQLTPTFDPQDTFTACETVFTGSSGFSGEWLTIGQHCNGSGPNRQCRADGSLLVFNPGTESTGTEAFVALYISQDETLDPSDQFFASLTVSPLEPGGGQTILRFNERVPGRDDLSGMFLIAVLDYTNIVPEVNEANNVIVSLSIPAR